MVYFFFFFQAEDGIRDYKVTGVQTCALPISEKEHLESLHPFAPAARIKDARSALGALRQVKSEIELKLIQHATACTMDGLRAAARELRPNLFEYEIAALL